MSAAMQKTWFGQPRGLTILFLTQMWELFSYYGMRTLLVYYMTKQLLFAQEKASFVYGTYTALAYFTPILGGAIADRWLGKRNAVILGGSIMALGHFAMAFEPLFYLALATIALGNGLFLPSLPSQINDLYSGDDPRRGRAYNVYYVGLNAGGLLAPLVCGTLGELYGWHYGFGAAGIGMFAGLLVYVFGRRYLPPEAPRPLPPPAGAARHGKREVWLLLLGVGIAATVFRGAYEQVGNTLPLWIDGAVDRGVGTLQIPMTWFLSLNPLFVIALTPPLLAYWRRRAGAGREIPPARKMAIGALVVAAAYVMLAAVDAASAGAATRAGWPWLVAFFLVLTLGELYILPTGLGLFARLAPPRLGATTVASWFLAIFSGSLLAGIVGTLWTHVGHPAFFLLLATLAVLAAAMLWRLDRPIRRHIHP